MAGITREARAPRNSRQRPERPRGRNWGTAQDVADTWRTSLRTVWRWHEQGRITGYKISPGLVRFDLDEVEAELLGGGK
jgi:hypothetical protein